MPHHSLFRRFISLSLALLVLTASVGLSVQRQTCRMSGRSIVDVSVLGQAAPSIGCGEVQVAAALPVAQAQDACCDFSSHLHKLSTPAHKLAAQGLLPAPLLAVLPAPSLAGPVGAFVARIETSPPRWFAADSSPPPLGGRGFLAWACTLVV